MPDRLIVAMTGASGVIFGIRVLELLRTTGVEAHLVLSRWASRTLLHETSHTSREAKNLAARWYSPQDQGAPISSGSFLTRGMAVVPCSMRTVAAIAHGLGDTLIHRAADVTLKERRKLVLVVRETPLNDIHLENMLKLSRMGAVIFPPVPAFYHRPRTIADIVTYTAVRILDQFDIHVEVPDRWEGIMAPGTPEAEA